MGIEPTPSAWKAEVLPLNYTRATDQANSDLLCRTFAVRPHANPLESGFVVVEGEGFEPSKAEPTDLQSAPFDRSGTPPKSSRIFSVEKL